MKKATLLDYQDEIEATIKLMQREIDGLRAQLRDQTARLAGLRPQVAAVPPWVATFERRLDILAAEVARLSQMIDPVGLGL